MSRLQAACGGWRRARVVVGKIVVGAVVLGSVVLLASSAGAQDVVRTPDITARGLKNSDFPRITKLAERVYSYERVDPTKRIVTVNNLFVITSQGVLVADGQGTFDNTTRLVADIAKLTPLPIKYVVVGGPTSNARPLRRTGGRTRRRSSSRPTRSATSGSCRWATPKSRSSRLDARTPVAISRCSCRGRRFSG